MLRNRQKSSESGNYQTSLPLVGFALAVVVALSSNAWSAGQDDDGDLGSIELIDGKSLPLYKPVTTDDFSYVGTGKRKFPSFKVRRVYRPDAPGDYEQGLTYFDQGSYRWAAKHFDDAMKGAGKSKWIKEYCCFYLGMAFYENGDFEPGGYVGKKTGKQYQPVSWYFSEAMKVNPKSRFLLEATVRHAIALAKEGQFDKAEAAFKKAKADIQKVKNATQLIAGSGDSIRKAEAFRNLGYAEHLELRETQKGDGANWDPVRRAYKSAESGAGKYPSIKRLAIQGLIRALLNLKNYDEVKFLASRQIDKADKGELPAEQLAMLPAAYDALGQVYYRQAVEEAARKNLDAAAEKYAEARWNFLQVALQFVDSDEYAARAYYFAGDCTYELKAKESGAEKLAASYWKTVVDDYPASKFAGVAGDALKKVAPEEAPQEAAPAEEKKGEGEAPKEAAEPKKAAPAPIEPGQAAPKKSETSTKKAKTNSAKKSK